MQATEHRAGAPSSNGVLLESRQLTKRFGGLVAVNKVDVAVPKGTIFSVIGPNGAGKTTFFNMVTGLIRPSDGELIYYHEDGKGGVQPIWIGGRPPNFLKAALTPLTGLGLLAGAVLGALLALGLGFLTTDLVVVVLLAVLVLGLGLGLTLSMAGNQLTLGLPPNGLVAGGALGLAIAIPVMFVIADALDLFPYSMAVAGVTLLGIVLGLISARVGPHYTTSVGICRTFQNIRLFANMTALENVLVGMHTRVRGTVADALLRPPWIKREERVAVERAREILRTVNLEWAADYTAKSLPYGEQRRLEIARALASNPQLLLLDEPTAGMNPQETATMMRFIKELQQQQGLTILLIEHDMKVVMGISDYIVVLDYGAKIAEGTPAEVRADPRVIEAYLGKGAAGTDGDAHLARAETRLADAGGA